MCPMAAGAALKAPTRAEVPGLRSNTTDESGSSQRGFRSVLDAQVDRQLEQKRPQDPRTERQLDRVGDPANRSTERRIEPRESGGADRPTPEPARGREPSDRPVVAKAADHTRSEADRPVRDLASLPCPIVVAPPISPTAASTDGGSSTGGEAMDAPSALNAASFAVVPEASSAAIVAAAMPTGAQARPPTVDAAGNPSSVAATVGSPNLETTGGTSSRSDGSNASASCVDALTGRATTPTATTTTAARSATFAGTDRVGSVGTGNAASHADTAIPLENGPDAQPGLAQKPNGDGPSHTVGGGAEANNQPGVLSADAQTENSSLAPHGASIARTDDSASTVPARDIATTEVPRRDQRADARRSNSFMTVETAASFEGVGAGSRVPTPTTTRSSRPVLSADNRVATTIDSPARTVATRPPSTDNQQQPTMESASGASIGPASFALPLVKTPGSSAAAGAPVATTIAEGQRSADLVTSDVVGVIRSLRDRDGTHSMSIELHPADLGRVRIDLEMRHGVAHVVLSAEHATADAILRRAMPQLRESLQESGVRAGRLDIGSDLPPNGSWSGGATSANDANTRGGDRRTRLIEVDPHRPGPTEASARGSSMVRRLDNNSTRLDVLL